MKNLQSVMSSQISNSSYINNCKLIIQLPQSNYLKFFLLFLCSAMPKHGFLTPKAIGNRIKAKGLQKLKFYCQMCQKQCRDENGFKCHTMSESHQRQLLLFADNADSYLDQFSLEFKDEYVGLLKRRFNGRRVNANHAYQEYIADRDHVHMNSTQWETLTEFVKWMGREGIVKADETEKGWYVTYIDRDPEAIARAEKKNKMVATDEERQEKMLLEQIERAKANNTDSGPSSSTVLQRTEDSEEKVVFAMPKSIRPKKVEPAVEMNALQEKDLKPSKSYSKSKNNNKKKRSAIEELIAENEAGKKQKKKKDSWLAKGIVVKIIAKDLGKEFYKSKGLIEDVFDTYGAKVKVIKTGKRVKLDQSHLETVIPQVGRKIMILNGAYEGSQAILDKLNVEHFTVNVTISSGICKGRTVPDIPYEDVSKLYTND